MLSTKDRVDSIIFIIITTITNKTPKKKLIIKMKIYPELGLVNLKLIIYVNGITAVP